MGEAEADAETRGFQPLHATVRAAKQGFGVAAAHEGEAPIRWIKDAIDEGEEDLALVRLRPQLVEALRDLGGAQRGLVQRGAHALHFRGVEGGGGALAAHIGDEEGEAAIGQREKVVIVAGHFLRGEDRRFHLGGQVHRGEIRQQAHLHLARDAQLLLQGHALLTLIQRSLELHGHVIEVARQHAHLIAAARAHARGEIALGEAADARVEVIHGTAERPREAHAEDHRHHLEHDHHDQQRGDAHHHEDVLDREVAALVVAESVAAEEHGKVRAGREREDHGLVRRPIRRAQARGRKGKGMEEAAALRLLARGPGQHFLAFALHGAAGIHLDARHILVAFPGKAKLGATAPQARALIREAAERKREQAEARALLRDGAKQHGGLAGGGARVLHDVREAGLDALGELIRPRDPRVAKQVELLKGGVILRFGRGLRQRGAEPGEVALNGTAHLAAQREVAERQEEHMERHHGQHREQHDDGPHPPRHLEDELLPGPADRAHQQDEEPEPEAGPHPPGRNAGVGEQAQQQQSPGPEHARTPALHPRDEALDHPPASGPATASTCRRLRSAPGPSHNPPRRCRGRPRPMRCRRASPCGRAGSAW